MLLQVLIIGSGIAGLACAIRMRSLGLEVDVYEANNYPGGKLTAFNSNGYRFDAGPSLFTMPHLVDELFRTAGKETSKYFQYQKIDVSCQYFFSDGARLTAWADSERLARELEENLGVDGKIVRSYLQESRFIYEKAAHIFLENSLHQWKTWLTRDVAKALSQIPRFHLNTNLDALNRRKLKHPKLVQLFNRYATYNGSSPYQTPGIMASIPHLEYNIGTYFPTGGMHAITQSLYRLAMDIGVRFHFDHQVESIYTTKGKAKGIKVKGDLVKGDIVVSNMDVYPTYRRLLPHEPPPEKALKQERSSSALIFYWGMRRQFKELHLHNIFFGENYRQEFESIFHKKEIADDPTIYINITSKYQSTDAPRGCENWFVMVNTPANYGQDWDKLIKITRNTVIDKLTRQLNQPIGELIQSEAILDPRSIESNTQSYRGSLYGTSSNSKMAAFLRHPNFTRKIKGLYFCGGSVHPGGGIPLCLLSAKIVSDLVQKYELA